MGGTAGKYADQQREMRTECQGEKKEAKKIFAKKIVLHRDNIIL